MSKSATLTYTLILRTGFWCTLLADDDGIGRVSYTIWLTSICCSRFCLRLIPERGSVYIVVVFLLMLVLPVVSVVHDRSFSETRLGCPSWSGGGSFFAGVGVRLFSAGISQTANPRFTAVTILGLKTSESWMVVRELGFGNLAIGALALGSIAARTWITPSALAGAVFYGLAAINHIAKKNRNRLENFTLLSDVFACCVLCVYLLSVIQAR